MATPENQKLWLDSLMAQSVGRAEWARVSNSQKTAQSAQSATSRDPRTESNMMHGSLPVYTEPCVSSFQFSLSSFLPELALRTILVKSPRAFLPTLKNVDAVNRDRSLRWRHERKGEARQFMSKSRTRMFWEFRCRCRSWKTPSQASQFALTMRSFRPRRRESIGARYLVTRQFRGR